MRCRLDLRIAKPFSHHYCWYLDKQSLYPSCLLVWYFPIHDSVNYKHVALILKVRLLQRVWIFTIPGQKKVRPLPQTSEAWPGQPPNRRVGHPTPCASVNYLWSHTVHVLKWWWDHTFALATSSYTLRCLYAQSRIPFLSTKGDVVGQKAKEVSSCHFG